VVIAESLPLRHISRSLALALVEHESSFQNVFGHDPSIYRGAGRVTRLKYARYRRLRGHTHMQGVGPLQLTWWELQDEADRAGGCWVPRINIRIGLRHLDALITQYGRFHGLARYNGSGSAARQYAVDVDAGAKRWRHVLLR
jgi:hypothetical protein